MADRLATKARVLEDFYRRARSGANGRCRISEAVASRRLGRVFYQAGRAQLAEGHVARARVLLRKSIAYGQPALRSRALLLLTSALPCRVLAGR
jgi:hypothetical protein